MVMLTVMVVVMVMVMVILVMAMVILTVAHTNTLMMLTDKSHFHVYKRFNEEHTSKPKWNSG